MIFEGLALYSIALRRLGLAYVSSSPRSIATPRRKADRWGMFEEVISQSSRKPEGLPGVLERRRTKRLPMLRSSHTSLTTHLWELEFIPAFGLTRLIGDIEALAARSLESNIFFEADVVRSAWPRLTSLLAPKGCWMMCLWETIGEARYLRPLHADQAGAGRFPAAHGVTTAVERVHADRYAAARCRMRG